MTIPDALLIGRAVYRCGRGHEQHEAGPCNAVVHRHFKPGRCGGQTTFEKYEPSELALRLGARNGLRDALATATDETRATIESALAKAEQRLVSAAVDAGLSWDEARRL